MEELKTGEESQVITEQQEKTFTQAELDKIIAERVARVKAEKPSDYDDLREMATDLEDYGFVGTVAEKKAALKAAKEQVRLQNELESLEEEADRTGTSPELLREIRELKKELKEVKDERKALNEVDEAKRKEAEAKIKIDADWDRQLTELNEAHSDVDPEELAKDAKFIKFAKSHKGDIKEIYEDYLELMEDAAQNIAEKFKRSELRSTGGGKTPPSSSGAKLSTAQQSTLEDWNKRNPRMKMTPQEFLSRQR